MDKNNVGPDDFSEVLEHAQQGDSWAVDAIFEQYKGLVRAKSRIYFLIGADSEDLIQEGMIGLYKAIRDYKPERFASFAAFAEMCVTRQIITAVKTATRQKHIPLNTYISLSKPSCGGEDEDSPADSLLLENAVPDPEEILIDHENSVRFWEDIKRLLSDLEQSVLALYLKGEPYAAMSSALGKPEKAIDNTLQRVKKKLEKYLVTYKES